MITYKESKPSLEEFNKLRDSVNWNLAERGVSDERARQSLSASPYCVCAYDGEKIIGMVRISGDLFMYGHIQDTIVLPMYQKKGIGREMMKKLLEKISGLEGYLLGVCPSKVSVEFYSKFGFKKRPENPNGYMSIEM